MTPKETPLHAMHLHVVSQEGLFVKVVGTLMLSKGMFRRAVKLVKAVCSPFQRTARKRENPKRETPLLAVIHLVSRGGKTSGKSVAEKVAEWQIWIAACPFCLMVFLGAYNAIKNQ